MAAPFPPKSNQLYTRSNPTFPENFGQILL